MKMNKVSYRRMSDRTSSALVLTLFFIALISILLVGFLASMRLETVSSRSHLKGVEAGIYALAGLDTAEARLYSVLSDPSRTWITEGGALMASPSGTNQPVTTLVDLSSGLPASSSSDAANMNPYLPQTGANLIASTNAPMYVNWIYVYQNGMVTNTASAGAIGNAPIGRYAFWVDDESAKIDLNTAGQRSGNTNGLSDPSLIDLTAETNFDGGDITNLVSFTATNLLNSPAEVNRISTNMGAVVDQDKFFMTHYNHAPEINMFGEPRIMLTTSKAIANACGSTNFIDIVNNSDPVANDPGYLGNLNTANVATVVSNLNRELTRANWPILPGKSFAQKYNQMPDQIMTAMDIIDYVRSAESTNNLVESLRGTMSGGNSGTFQMSLSQGTSGIYLGDRYAVARRLEICEAAVWVPSTPTEYTNNGSIFWKLPYTVMAKVYYPQTQASTPTPADLTACQLYFQNFHSKDPPGTTNWASADATAPLTTSQVWSPSSLWPNGQQTTTLIYPGHYATIMRSLYNLTNMVPNSQTPPAAPTNFTFQVILDRSPTPTIGEHIDAVTISSFANYAPASATAVVSTSVDDPSVNKVSGDWKQPPSGQNPPNYFGVDGPNLYTSTLGKSPTLTGIPQQDTVGGILVNGMLMPSAKGTPGNPLGLVRSVGELGYVHTGVEYWNGAGNKGVPWRTIRLQPKTTIGDLPDWALLDLFCVPILPGTRDRAVITPQTNLAAGIYNVGGKINLNTTILPFTNSSSFSRTLPLQALFQNTTNLLKGSVNTTSQAQSLVSNIVNHTLATNGLAYANTNVYYTPAQIAEISGVADGGEASEEQVREVVGVATTRGNVFSLYAVGQALQQDNFGVLHVLSERRYHKMMEAVWSNGQFMMKPVYIDDGQP